MLKMSTTDADNYCYYYYRKLCNSMGKWLLISTIIKVKVKRDGRMIIVRRRGVNVMVIALLQLTM